MTTKHVSQCIGLGVHVLQNWRSTDVGPPYVRFTHSDRGHVRYRIREVLEWQKSCLRVVPENWHPIGSLPGENVAAASDRIQWLPPGRAAAAIGIAIATTTAWRKRKLGLPFIWIGGGGSHPIMYDRRDVDAFITRRQADPSIVPKIKSVWRSAPCTIEERKRMSAEVAREIGCSDEEIRRMLGRRYADLIWPK